MKERLLASISLAQYRLINKLRYTFRKSQYKPLNVRDVFQIVSRKKKSTPFFIQVGSFDGISNDPVFEFVNDHNWLGILVEPMPPFFEKLKNNYSHKKGLVFENVGIGDQAGAFDFFYLPAEYNEPAWLQQLSSFDKNSLVVNLKDSHPQLIDHIQKRTINAITLSQLVQKHNVKEIDVLNIDAEGYEYKILKDLDSLAVKPNIILFEWGCMPKDEFDKLILLLNKNQYSLYASGADMAAISEQAFKQYR